MACIRLRRLGGDLGALSGRRISCALEQVGPDGGARVLAATPPHAVPLGASCAWGARLECGPLRRTDGALWLRLADADDGGVLFECRLESRLAAAGCVLHPRGAETPMDVREAVHKGLVSVYKSARRGATRRAAEQKLIGLCAHYGLVFLSVDSSLVEPEAEAAALALAADPALYYSDVPVPRAFWEHRRALLRADCVFALVLAADSAPGGPDWLYDALCALPYTSNAFWEGVAACHRVGAHACQSVFAAVLDEGFGALLHEDHVAEAVALVFRYSELGLFDELAKIWQTTMDWIREADEAHAALAWAMFRAEEEGLSPLSFPAADVTSGPDSRVHYPYEAQHAFWKGVVGLCGRVRRTDALRAALGRVRVPRGVPLLPWDSVFCVSSLCVDRCRVFPSAGRPSLVVFSGSGGASGESFRGAVVKAGGDVSRDAFVLRVLRLFDGVWAEAQREVAEHMCALLGHTAGSGSALFPCDSCVAFAKDFRTRPHHAVPLFRHGGIVEWLPDSVPLSQCPALSPSVPLAASVAAWTVATFVLGIGDRHADNVLVDVSAARVSHVDCAYLWGAEPRPFVPGLRLCAALRAASPSFDLLRAAILAGHRVLRLRASRVLAAIVSAPAPPAAPHAPVRLRDWLADARRAAAFVHGRLRVSEADLGALVDASAADAALPRAMDALHSLVQYLRE